MLFDPDRPGLRKRKDYYRLSGFFMQFFTPRFARDEILRNAGDFKNKPNLGGKDGDKYDDKDEEERLYAR